MQINKTTRFLLYSPPPKSPLNVSCKDTGSLRQQNHTFEKQSCLLPIFLFNRFYKTCSRVQAPERGGKKREKETHTRKRHTQERKSIYHATESKATLPLIENIVSGYIKELYKPGISEGIACGSSCQTLVAASSSWSPSEGSKAPSGSRLHCSETKPPQNLPPGHHARGQSAKLLLFFFFKFFAVSVKITHSNEVSPQLENESSSEKRLNRPALRPPPHQ